jgi:hypothetical protein
LMSAVSPKSCRLWRAVISFTEEIFCILVQLLLYSFRLKTHQIIFSCLATMVNESWHLFNKRRKYIELFCSWPKMH